MATQPCLYCHRVPKGPLHGLIWAWYAERVRIAVRTRSCSQCLLAATAPFGEALPEEGDYVQLPTSCQHCSEPVVAEELVEVYLTDCFRGDREKSMFAICSRCAEVRLAELRGVGELLPDRPLYAARRGP